MESIIGIDPGKSGGIALLYRMKVNGKLTKIAKVWKMPETERDVWECITNLQWRNIDLFAFIEQVAAMPKQGVSSTFKFGQHYGMLRAFLIAAGISFETIWSSKWQRKLGCLSKSDKNVTKAKAQELFPEIKITHATADALLIAEYGYRKRREEILGKKCK